jgi:hypothetical protein
MSFFSKTLFSPSNSAPANGQPIQQRQVPFPPNCNHTLLSQPQSVHPWSVHRLNLLPPTVLSKKAPPPGPSPSPLPRFGHALSATPTAAGELFLFGGLAHGSLRNDLYVISTRDLSTTLLQTRGELPSSRFGHAGARISTVLLIWGGATNIGDQAVPNKPEDDSLYLLNLGTLDLLMSRTTLAD